MLMALPYLLLCRTPPGVRELKPLSPNSYAAHSSRTPPGVRELKLPGMSVESDGERRTPPGVRELKPPRRRAYTGIDRSHPSRGA